MINDPFNIVYSLINMQFQTISDVKFVHNGLRLGRDGHINAAIPHGLRARRGPDPSCIYISTESNSNDVKNAKNDKKQNEASCPQLAFHWVQCPASIKSPHFDHVVY